MSSYNHRVRPIAQAERDYQCVIIRCTRPAKFAGIYDYATGQAGRRSSCCRHMCEEHARRFASNHGIDFDAQIAQHARQCAELASKNSGPTLITTAPAGRAQS